MKPNNGSYISGTEEYFSAHRSVLVELKEIFCMFCSAGARNKNGISVTTNFKWSRLCLFHGSGYHGFVRDIADVEKNCLNALWYGRRFLNEVFRFDSQK